MPARKKTILVVEDEPDAREMTTELLEAQGHRVAVAVDGDQAIGYLSESAPPDLVLLDLRLPKTDGWAVFVWIKSRPKLKSVPVIIVSGMPIPEERKALINQKAPFWLEKPVPPEELLRAIEQHF